MREGVAGGRGRILVLGDHRQTPTVVRSLARAGYEVILGADRPRSPTSYSRHVSDVWVYDASSAERYANHLEAFLRSERPDFVFPVGESQLRPLVAKGARFEPLATWASPPFATVARCFDKRAIYELAPGLGVPTLPWQPYTSGEDWRAQAAQMGFPVVVKRKDSAATLLDRKALVFASAAAFDAFLARLSPGREAEALVLQKFARGTRHNCHLAAVRGELLAYFEQKVLRTDEPDATGIGITGASVAPSSRLRGYCAALVRALEYSGVGCIQFQVDESTGEVGLLEFNPRMDSTATLPVRLGFDFPRLAVEIAAGRLGPSREPTYPTGKTYHWLHGDLTSWIVARKNGARPRTLIAHALQAAWFCCTSHHLTFDWRDPLPTLVMYWRKFVRHPLRRRRKLPRAAVG